MKKIFFSLLVCGMFWTGLVAQTKTDDSGVWIIGGGGKKPSRVVLLADENSIKSVKVGSRTAVDIAIRQVAEDPNYTGLLSGNARVFCDKGTIAANDVTMVNKGKVSKIPDDPESEAKSEGEKLIVNFVCNQGKDERQRIYPPTVETFKTAGKTGFLFIGQKDTNYGAENLVRDVFWSDKDFKKLSADLRAKTEVLQKQIDHLKSVAGDIKNQKAQMEDESRRAKARANGATVRRLQRLMGGSENDVVAAFGKPYNSKDDGAGNRWLSYYQYKDSRQMISQRNMQIPVGELLECNVTVLIYNGKVYDYTASENVNDACSDLGF